MDISVYPIKSVSDEKIKNLIVTKQSFVLEEIDRFNMGEAVTSVEKAIKSAGYKCRVYSKGRAASVGVWAAAGVFPPAAAIGFISALAIGAHNLVTFSPDYEIAKNLATGTLTVTWQKG